MIDLKKTGNLPTRNYGVREFEEAHDPISVHSEAIRRNGFSVIEGAFSSGEIEDLKNVFTKVHTRYLRHHGGLDKLSALDEHNTVRLPLKYEFESMYEVLAHPELLAVIDQCISGSYLLNQQNLIINPSQQDYNQGAWHRDLPYQHYVSSSPLAINAILCVDDFTKENGASFVLPASHLIGAYPSESFIENNAIQVEARAGSYIVMDCMVFHSGGYNSSSGVRRAINQVFSIPHIKQQINIPNSINGNDLDCKQKSLLGFGLETPSSVEDYLMSRV